MPKNNVKQKIIKMLRHSDCETIKFPKSAQMINLSYSNHLQKP